VDLNRKAAQKARGRRRYEMVRYRVVHWVPSYLWTDKEWKDYRSKRVAPAVVERVGK
jgi:hypothetical protein